MIIQISTDKTLKGAKNQVDFFSTQIAKELERFESHITRIEVHLKDENGIKEGFNEISCLLEARLEGKQPIAVKNQADTVELAISGATSKVKAAIKTIVGRSQNR
ncbi:MAG: HPF/RaiA family ribosome-associated protein [Crocinitomix sp.]|nr:HPF/RaiA family ribosome-associated protein [Crocinitomix sp.]